MPTVIKHLGDTLTATWNGLSPRTSDRLTLYDGVGVVAFGPSEGITGGAANAVWTLTGGTLAAGQTYTSLRVVTTADGHTYSISDLTVQMVASGTRRDLALSFSAPVTDIAEAASVLSAEATEYVHVGVTPADSATGQSVDITGDTVSLAFLTSGTPAAGDWAAAQWITRTAGGASQVYARALVGPEAGGTLPPGNLAVWIRIQDSPEDFVERVGTLTVR